MAWSSCVCLILALGPQLCTNTPSSKHLAVIRCGLLLGYMNGRMLTVCCPGQSDLCSGLHVDGFIESFGEIVPLCLCVSLLLHQGLLCSLGDIWHCLETLSIVTTGVGSHRHLSWVEAARHPTCVGQPNNKELPSVPQGRQHQAVRSPGVLYSTNLYVLCKFAESPGFLSGLLTRTAHCSDGTEDSESPGPLSQLVFLWDCVCLSALVSSMLKVIFQKLSQVSL